MARYLSPQRIPKYPLELLFLNEVCHGRNIRGQRTVLVDLVTSVMAAPAMSRTEPQGVILGLRKSRRWKCYLGVVDFN